MKGRFLSAAIAAGLFFFGQAANAISPDGVGKAYVIDYNLVGSGDSRTRVTTAFLVQLYQKSPEASPDLAGRLADRVGEGWSHAFGPDSGEDAAARQREIFALGKDILALSSGKVSVEVANDLRTVLTDEFLRQSAEWERGQAVRTGQSTLGVSAAQWGSRYSPIQMGNTIYDAVELAEKNPKAAAVLNGIFARASNGSQLVDPLPMWLRDNQAAASSWKQSEFLSMLTEDSNRHRELIRQQAVLNGNALDSLHAIEQRLAAQQRREAEAAQRAALDRQIDEKYAPFFAVTGMIQYLGRGDQTVQALTTIGKSVLSMVSNTDRFEKGLMDPTLYMNFMSGNYLAMCTQMTKMMGMGPPSDLEIILKAIGQLEKEIADLRQEMLTQFQELKEQISRGFADVHEHLDALESDIRYGNRDIKDLLQQNLSASQLVMERLDRLSNDVWQSFSDLHQSELRVQGLKLEWPQMDFQSFSSALDRFRVCAIQDAASTLEAGYDVPGDPDRPDDDIRFFAKASSLLATGHDNWERFNIVQSSVHRLLPGLASPRLGNPRAWALCAGKYEEMARKWPAIYAQYDPQGTKLAELLSAGEATRRYLYGLRLADPEGKSGDDVLVRQALTTYQFLTEQFARHLLAEEGAFWVADGPTRAVHPFQSLEEQRTSLRAIAFAQVQPLAKLKPCRNPMILVSSYFKPMVPDLPLDDTDRAALADKFPLSLAAAIALRIGDLDLCYEIDPTRVSYDMANANCPPRVKDKFSTLIPAGGPKIGLYRYEYQVRYRFRKLGAEPVTIAYLRATSPYLFDFYLSNTLYEEYGPSAKSHRVDEWIGMLWPRIKSTLYDGAGEKQIAEYLALEQNAPPMPQPLVYHPTAPVTADLDNDLKLKLDSITKDITRSYSTALRQPGGDLAQLRSAINGARELVGRSLSLVTGDWLASEDARDLRERFKALPTGEAIFEAAAADPSNYLNQLKRGDKLNGLLKAPIEGLHESLERHQSERLRYEASGDLSTHLPGYGHHAFLEVTLDKLRAFRK